MYKYALTRKPGENFHSGQTEAQLGAPQQSLVLQQHQTYCEALRKCNIDVQILEAHQDYPDAPFVEDTAVVTENLAIITRLGAKSRQGEEQSIREQLSQHKRIEVIDSGTIEGGDVMRIDNHFFIGISRRTNEEGAKQLGDILRKQGYTWEMVPVPTQLHLKTGVTYIGEGILVMTQEFANSPAFSKYDKIVVTDSETYAANCLWINNTVIMPKDFPLTKAQLSGRDVIELDMSEFRKMDGGLTCLSLLW
ncbi:dimethylarginine dimethylaminohydrolase family protein [Candidatus Uabimicrobium amorphum]|uniref:Dimethylargininase n=1 Tax=Uabimicrobium amorphum TaxID=2596890 RepID=A0A5S9IKN5_UABAM|nr:arginine deiminase family protein [Candidatus Uabimicrobium amorphum]BBM82345.1 dimethylargininase [Candidatus Uabimicrobium amorphum]